MSESLIPGFVGMGTWVALRGGGGVGTVHVLRAPLRWLSGRSSVGPVMASRAGKRQAI